MLRKALLFSRRSSASSEKSASLTSTMLPIRIKPRLTKLCKSSATERAAAKASRPAVVLLKVLAKACESVFVFSACAAVFSAANGVASEKALVWVSICSETVALAMARFASWSSTPIWVSLLARTSADNTSSATTPLGRVGSLATS